MTRKTNARLAGFMFLFYIVTGIANLVLFNQATSGAEGIAWDGVSEDEDEKADLARV